MLQGEFGDIGLDGINGEEVSVLSAAKSIYNKRKKIDKK